MSMTAKRRLHDIYQLNDFEKAVKRYLPKAVYEYVRNGAGAELSLRRNRAIFQRYLWRPYRLRNVSSVNTKITLFGEEYAQPFGLAPTGGAAMTRYDADRIEQPRRDGIICFMRFRPILSRRLKRSFASTRAPGLPPICRATSRLSMA
ncbi:alpha-hydroxy-acid oxidizing protein [Asaia platycodi]|uniref:alpha-hydroxy-acid oxidizing protein n=1 Tax=Asaia platycodi TaxID=610243 RepID=UPI000B040501|nr:alpha-hydroxy-acid oxidizing protein [Asaia platycodi]